LANNFASGANQTPTEAELRQKLAALQSAHADGLITDEEHKLHRTQVLELFTGNGGVKPAPTQMSDVLSQLGVTLANEREDKILHWKPLLRAAEKQRQMLSTLTLEEARESMLQGAKREQLPAEDALTLHYLLYATSRSCP